MDNSLEKPVVQNGTPRRRNSRLAIIVVAVLLVAGIAAFVIILNKRGGSSASGSSNASSETVKPAETAEEKEETKEAKKEPEKETAQKEPEQKSEDIVEGKTPVNQDGGGANSEETLTGVINYAAVNDGTLMIRVSIDQYLESGECLLELNSPSDSFTLTDQIAPSAATSTCSYDIATSLLEEGSKYDIKITVTGGDKKGIIKGEVDV